VVVVHLEGWFLFQPFVATLYPPRSLFLGIDYF
jgi:hypothetical protein